MEQENVLMRSASTYFVNTEEGPVQYATIKTVGRGWEKSVTFPVSDAKKIIGKTVKTNTI